MAHLTISLTSLRRNYSAMCKASGPAETAAVVKANAYGLGLEKVSQALSDEGCKTFFVAHISEAVRLRAVAPNATIYVLNGLFSEDIEAYLTHDLRPVLGSMPEVNEWAAFCRARTHVGLAALHIDTGMNRHGLDLAEASRLAEPGVGADGVNELGFTPSLVMSHFVAAEEGLTSLTQKQIQRFASIRPLFSGVQASLANSGGIMLGEAARFDLTRAGIALYGGSFQSGKAGLEPVISLQTPIVQVRELRKGDTVSYNATWQAERPSKVALLSVGYADGFLRSASGSFGHKGAQVRVNTILCPVIGRITMDLTVIDVTEAGQVERGTPAFIFDDVWTVDHAAKAAGTIGYEMLTALGNRYTRTYEG